MASKVRIKCFLLQPTSIEARFLRRWARQDTEEGKETECTPGNWYHNAMVRIEDGPRDGKPLGDLYPHEDPRWPKKCACGYEFKETDHWQLFRATLFKAPDGKIYSIHSGTLPQTETAPAGALWYVSWYDVLDQQGKPPLVVRCPRNPDGTGVADWIPSMPGRTGKQNWTLTGEAPLVTGHPSIFISPPNGFHGWLKNGELVGC